MDRYKPNKLKEKIKKLLKNVLILVVISSVSIWIYKTYTETEVNTKIIDNNTEISRTSAIEEINTIYRQQGQGTFLHSQRRFPTSVLWERR